MSDGFPKSMNELSKEIYDNKQKIILIPIGMSICDVMNCYICMERRVKVFLVGMNGKLKQNKSIHIATITNHTISQCIFAMVFRRR